MKHRVDVVRHCRRAIVVFPFCVCALFCVQCCCHYCPSPTLLFEHIFIALLSCIRSFWGATFGILHPFGSNENLPVLSIQMQGHCFCCLGTFPIFSTGFCFKIKLIFIELFCSLFLLGEQTEISSSFGCSASRCSKQASSSTLHTTADPARTTSKDLADPSVMS